MKFLLLKEDIIEGLQKSANIIAVKSGATYLKTIWLKAEESSVQVMATDSNTEFIGRYPASVEEQGLIGVPGKKFFMLINKLPPGEIKFTLDSVSGNLILQQGRRKYNITTNDPDWFQEFNFFPDVDPVNLNIKKLRDAIDRVFYSIDDDEEQKGANCISFSRAEGDEITACGLSMHQIAMVNLKNPDFREIIPENGILIPRKNVQELRRCLAGDEVRFTRTDDRLYFQRSDLRECISFSTVNFTFPNYQALVNRFTEVDLATLHADKFEFSDSLERMEVFNSENSMATFINFFDNEIHLTAQGDTLGDGSETIKASFSGDLKKIVVPTKGLITVFSHFESSNLVFDFTGEAGPFMITGKEDPDYKVVFMPIVVSEDTYYTEVQE